MQGLKAIAEKHPELAGEIKAIILKRFDSVAVLTDAARAELEQEVFC
jgi:hypothetical protein